jgi:hypothetical protein
MCLIPAVILVLMLALQAAPADAAPLMGITPTATYTPLPTPTRSVPYQIPEPSTLALLGGGLATLLGFLQLKIRRR